MPVQAQDVSQVASGGVLGPGSDGIAVHVCCITGERGADIGTGGIEGLKEEAELFLWSVTCLVSLVGWGERRTFRRSN